MYVHRHTDIYIWLYCHRWPNSQIPGSIRHMFKIPFIDFIYKCLSMILCESSGTSCNEFKFMWAIKKQLADTGNELVKSCMYYKSWGCMVLLGWCHFPVRSLLRSVSRVQQALWCRLQIALGCQAMPVCSVADAQTAIVCASVFVSGELLSYCLWFQVKIVTDQGLFVT